MSRCIRCAVETGNLRFCGLDCADEAIAEETKLANQVAFYKSENERFRSLLRAAEAKLVEAREVLRSVEWDSLRWDALTGREQGGYCVVCGGEDPRLDGTGHAPDCLLAAVLENS